MLFIIYIATIFTNAFINKNIIWSIDFKIWAENNVKSVAISLVDSQNLKFQQHIMNRGVYHLSKSFYSNINLNISFVYYIFINKWIRIKRQISCFYFAALLRPHENDYRKWKIYFILHFQLIILTNNISIINLKC